jgi:hypothetical protein
MGAYTSEALERVSHWVPDKAPKQLDVLSARHFDAVPADGNQVDGSHSLVTTTRTSLEVRRARCARLDRDAELVSGQ